MGGTTTLTEIIAAGLPDRDLRFVFPSAVAADAWARRAVETGLARAVDKDRFVAWDRFKEATLSVDRRDRKAANGAARSIFCAAFLAENAAAAETGAPRLKEIISPEIRRGLERLRILPLPHSSRPGRLLPSPGPLRRPYRGRRLP
jgi:hypothetical protein